MAIPQDINMGSYIIYRDIPPGEAYDATSSLSFFPPKGSDELFDALRQAFPHLKTHSERMRDAIIQFLLEERQAEQIDLSPAATVESTQTTWPSISSEPASVFSSPDLLNFATPASFNNSPQLQGAQLTQTSTTTSSQPSPPSLDQMTGVFSLSTNPQPKQRVRRKMTESEKVEYRKRRIVKACEKCAKKKRKCPHNQQEMKTLPTPSTKPGSASGTSKSNSPQSAMSATPSTQQASSFADPYTPAICDDVFDPTTFGSFGDFNMFDDPLPEFSVDELFDFDQFPAANSLFSNGTQETFIPSPHGHTYSAQDTSHQLRSGRTNSYSWNEGQFDTASILPEWQTQTHPSQQHAARDPRTDGSHMMLQSSQTPSQRHSAVRDPRTDESLATLKPSTKMVEAQSEWHERPHRGNSTVKKSHAGRDQPSLAARAALSNSLLSQPTVPIDHVERQSQLGDSSRHESAPTSISVSALSGSSFPRSAALRGRPQTTRLVEQPAVLDHAPDQRLGDRCHLSLGEGISRTGSLATELFRLRRRLPEKRGSHGGHGDAGLVAVQHVRNIRGQQSPEQLSAQANGGAYLQLESSDNPKSAHNNFAAMPTSRDTRTAPASSSKGMAATLPADSTSGVWNEFRLRDTKRYKDHHGRPQSSSLQQQLAFALGAAMLLAMVFFSSSSLLLLGLALLSPTSSRFDETLEAPVQCTAKNSSWLSAFAKGETSPDLKSDRALKNRQYIRGSASPAGISLFEAGPGAWLLGLGLSVMLPPLTP